jgi:hypothetical protein
MKLSSYMNIIDNIINIIDFFHLFIFIIDNNIINIMIIFMNLSLYMNIIDNIINIIDYFYEFILIHLYNR